MKTNIIVLLIILFGNVIMVQGQDKVKSAPSDPESLLQGEWVRMSPVGPIGLHFKSNGTVEGDLGRNNSIDIISSFTMENNTITFRDKEGASCPGKGIYEIHMTDYYVAFDLIEDNCGGRLKSTMGFWVRPDFEDCLVTLTERISASAEPADYLNRARLYMAIGKSMEAKQDLDQYIKFDSSDARVYINRAGTRFPSDMKGAVVDCNRALDLDPDSKNAYFLRGLAQYQLGEKQQACDDFYKAIELGFSVLKEAEKARCAEFWESYNSE